MSRLALRGLLARPRRSALSALAVALGVALVSGAYVVTDTSERAFAELASGPYRAATVVVAGQRLLLDATSGAAPLPQSLAGRLSTLPDVAAAAPIVFDPGTDADSIRLLDRRGHALTSADAPALGLGLDASAARFNPLRLASGRWPRGPGEVAIDTGTARRGRFAVGDAIGVAGRGPARPFRIVGSASYGSLASLGGGSVAAFTVRQAQELLSLRGEVDAILLAARPGVPASRLANEVAPLVPPSAEVRTAADQARADAERTHRFVRFLRLLLLAFAAIALVVGALVILNTLSLTAAQRTRERALLRALGASRGQLLRGALLEAAALGLAGSAAGLALGVAAARGLRALLNAFGAGLPATATVVAPHTIALSLGVGTLACVLAGVAPARRAAGIPPVEGLVAPAPARHPRAAAPLAAAAAIATAIGVPAHSRPLLALAAAALVAALAIGLPLLVAPLATAVGAPVRRFGGVPGRLAQESSRRTSSIPIAALAIGLALVAAVATVAAGLRASERAALERQLRADYAVTAPGGSPDLVAAVRRALPPGATAAAVVEARAAAFGLDVRVDGVAPRAFARVYRTGGTGPLPLGTDGAAVKRTFAHDHHLTLGSPIDLVTAAGDHVPLTVRAIYSPPAFDALSPLLGPVLVSQDTLTASFPRARTRYVLVRGGSAAALRRAVRAFPGVRVDTTARFVERQAATFDPLFGLLYVLLALALAVAILGVATTLALAVLERSRELALLRALGLTPAALRRMVLLEGGITAAIGAALGVPAGVALAALLTAALSSDGLGFSLPVATLAAIVAGAALAGALAAVAPARRAARTDVLEGLRYE